MPWETSYGSCQDGLKSSKFNHDSKRRNGETLGEDNRSKCNLLNILPALSQLCLTSSILLPWSNNTIVSQCSDSCLYHGNHSMLLLHQFHQLRSPRGSIIPSHRDYKGSEVLRGKIWPIVGTAGIRNQRCRAAKSVEVVLRWTCTIAEAWVWLSWKNSRKNAHDCCGLD